MVNSWIGKMTSEQRATVEDILKLILILIYTYHQQWFLTQTIWGRHLYWVMMNT